MGFIRIGEKCKKALFFIGFLAFLWIASGTLFRMLNYGFQDSSLRPQVGFFSCIFAIQLFFVVWLLFHCIELVREERQWIVSVVLFLTMLGVLIFLLVTLHPCPTADSLDDLDTALLLLNGGTVDSGIVHEFVPVYGNNHFLIVLFMVMFRFLRFFGISENVLLPFYILNVGAIMFSTFLAWRITGLLQGRRWANKVLLLMVLNPLYYGFVFWIYSLLYSLPILLGILYCGILLYRAQSKVRAMMLGGAIGVMSALGYELRVVVCFPILAALVMLPWLWRKSKGARQSILFGAIACIITGVLVVGCTSALKDKYFSKVKQYNYPLWYWFSLGSHDEGSWRDNEEDLEVANRYSTPEERKEALKERTINNYKELQFSGVVRIWLTKIQNTWSDGFCDLNGRLWAGEIDSPVYELLAGEQNLFARIYAESYRFLLEIGILLFLWYRLMFREANKFDVLIFLTIMGTMLFYAIWESKGCYSSPFVYLMAILAVSGFCEKETYIHIDESAKPATHHFIKCIYLGLVVIGVFLLCMIFKTEFGFNQFRIRTSVNDRAECLISGNGAIEQRFYCKDRINRIRFAVELPEKGNCSSYQVALYDEQGVELSNKKLSTKDISSGLLYMNLDRPVSSEGYYRLHIEKAEPGKNDILFVAKQTYYLDCFRGELSVADQDKYARDLKMDVIYRSDRRYFSQKVSMLLLLIYLVASGSVFAGYSVMCRKSN